MDPNAALAPTPAAPSDAAALAQAVAAATPQVDSGTTAYKQAADDAAHASALQAASALSGKFTQTSTVAASSAAIAPHVGSSGWDDAFSQQVVFLSSAKQQSAELTLNPKDLGPLQVTLQVTDNNAHALFVSQHAHVREAVEAALPKLREAMEQNGISLGSTSVNDGFARQQSQQQSGGQDSGPGGRSSGGIGAFGGLGGSDGTTAAVTVPVRRTVGLVDTFA
jgi:flagellar hook-length control protein FliK